MIMARQIATIIIGVFVLGLLFGYGMWRAAESADRASNDSRSRRRTLIRVTMLYIVVGVFIIVGVAARKERAETLYGLPASVIIIWFLLRTAIKTKVPPKE
jgi:cell division protein FtsW (lipid II flippase)